MRRDCLDLMLTISSANSCLPESDYSALSRPMKTNVEALYRPCVQWGMKLELMYQNVLLRSVVVVILKLMPMLGIIP